MRSQAHSIVQLMPVRSKLTVRGVMLAIAIGAAFAAVAAFWPKPGWLP